MISRLHLLLLASAVFAFVCQPAAASLQTYLARPEPAYHWEKRGEQAIEGVGRVYDLHLVSQVWQGIQWEHRLQIYWPDGATHPHFCALLNTGGSGSDSNTAMGLKLAHDTGCPFAILYNIPNQPLYGGKTEDALVVYTWLKYMETGDDSWPLHFPMAKAVLKAMDAIQAFTKETGLPAIDSFLVTGASKRGWTTWLVGASQDPRVKAIAPMVIDTLNLPAQVPHQLQAFGGPSEQVADYTKADMSRRLFTPEGRRLLALEDPYSYRQILTLPKLLILGTNDRYWAQDALNLYWDGLKGPRWVLYTPNSGHGLEDRERVINTLSAYIRTIAGQKPWPQMKWKYTSAPGGAQLTFRSDVAPVSARLFQAHADTMDLRNSRWTSEPVPLKGRSFTVTAPAPASGYTAIFGEATYDLDGHPFTLSTQIRILGGNQKTR